MLSFLIRFGIVLLAVRSAGGETMCAATPAGAVRAFQSGAQAAGGDGYRVASSRRDAVLGTGWATVERCGHPDWPRVTVAVGRLDAAGSVQRVAEDVQRVAVVVALPVVRAGETVRFWKRDQNVRLEMAAVTDQGGALGERIRLHVVMQQESGEGQRFAFGLVRGPADVEME